MKKTCKVLVVDDVDEMRVLMAEVLRSLPEFSVSGEVANTAQARLEISRRRPDLILLDEVLPGESSLDFLKEALAGGIAVLLVTSLEQPSFELPPGVLGRVKKPNWETTADFQLEMQKYYAVR